MFGKIFSLVALILLWYIILQKRNIVDLNTLLWRLDWWNLYFRMFILMESIRHLTVMSMFGLFSNVYHSWLFNEGCNFLTFSEATVVFGFRVPVWHGACKVENPWEQRYLELFQLIRRDFLLYKMLNLPCGQVNQVWSREKPRKKSKVEGCFGKSKTMYYFWVYLLSKVSNSTHSLPIATWVVINKT